jgi:type IV pilus assembly protein PilE
MIGNARLSIPGETNVRQRRHAEGLRNRAGVRGFTLIELMIVVGIVAILAAIAYPSYADSVRKSKRGHAKAALVELAQRAERYRTVNQTFAGFEDTLEEEDLVSPHPDEGPAAYALEFTPDEAGTEYELSAEPLGGQTADTRCMTLTLNQAGQKDVRDGATGNAADCW